MVAPGIPALRRSLVEAIQAGKYIDFGELPPARGLAKAPSSLASDTEGKIFLLQAADYAQSKKPILEFQTWSQCFALYAAVLTTKYPTRAQSLFLYSSLMAKLSKKFRWPSWIAYDQSFRREAADTGTANWTKIDSSIHTQCFTGMSLCEEGWCSICTSLDHVRTSCPYKPPGDHQTTPKQTSQRRSVPSNSLRPPPTKRTRPSFQSDEACRKWNKYHYMDCPHGDQCGYVHACSNCRSADHGILKCPTAKTTTTKPPPK